MQAMESDSIIDPNVKVNDQDGNPHQFNSNKEFTMHLLQNSLAQMFPNMNQVQIESLVLALDNSKYNY